MEPLRRFHRFIFNPFTTELLIMLLTVQERHQLKIAKQTVKNPSLSLLGGPSYDKALEIIKRLTSKS